MSIGRGAAEINFYAFFMSVLLTFLSVLEPARMGEGSDTGGGLRSGWDLVSKEAVNEMRMR